MYPISIGFSEAQKRIRALLENQHDAEALVTSVFTFEKLVRRSTRIAIIARGFSSKQADVFLDRKGFQDLSQLWAVFDKFHRPLHKVIGHELWQHVQEAIKMRNKFVHGNRVYKLEECRLYAEHLLVALITMHQQIESDFGRDPWVKMKSRINPSLSWITS